MFCTCRPGRIRDFSNLDKENNSISPLETAGLFSRIYFIWASKVIAKAASTNVISLDDLWPLRHTESSDFAVIEAEREWQNQLSSAKESAKDPSVARMIMKLIWYDLSISLVFKLGGWLLFATVSNSFLLQQTMMFIQDPSEPLWFGLILAFSIFVSETMRSISINQYWLRAVQTGMRIRSGLRHLVYKKALKLRDSSLNSKQVNIITVITADALRINEAINYGCFLISTPVTISLTLAIIIYTIGIAGLVGFVILISATLLQMRLGNYVSEVRRKAVKVGDERVKLMGELLTAIKLIKFFAWEKPFSDRISAIRAREMAQLRRGMYVRCVNSIVAYSVPVLVTLSTFAAHTLITKQYLTATEAFVTIALFNVARFPLSVVPVATKNVSEALVACTRISAFLMLPEVQVDDLPLSIESDSSIDSTSQLLVAKDATFEWPKVSTRPVSLPKVDQAALSSRWSFRTLFSRRHVVELKDEVVEKVEEPVPSKPAFSSVSFSISKGECVALVGSVGSGKSSILQALLGQLNRVSGNFYCSNKVASVSQNPWIFAGSLRENILFGKEYEQVRYLRVVEACALTTDIESLPAGDLTEIGERGINLSGGQKARIALARAIYSDADVFLLDDPLSAVDVHVGLHLWENAIEKLLKANGKGVLLVTHQLQYLPSMDRILLLQQGSVVAYGSYVDVEPTLKSMFESKSISSSNETDKKPVGDDLSLLASTSSNASKKDSSSFLPTKSSGTLVIEEDRQIGKVKVSTLFHYINGAGSRFYFWLLLSILLLAKVSKMVSDYWLSFWSQNNTTGVYSQAFFLGTYAILISLFILFTLFQSLSFGLITLKSAEVLHNKSFQSVLRACMFWFDSQPTGRILSRFTGDVDGIDSTLPASLEQATDYLLQCFLALVLLMIIFPVFLIPVVPFIAIFISLASFFRRAARELKRIDSLSRSPLVSHVTATLTGLSLIRVFSMQKEYERRSAKFSDQNQQTYWAFYAANRWIAIRLDVLTTLIAFFTVLFAVLFRNEITPGLAGLSVSYSLMMAGIFQYSVRLFSETESQMTSVERLRYYSNELPLEQNKLTRESELIIKSNSSSLPGWEESQWDKKLEAMNWPVNGEVEFKNVVLSYRPDLPHILKGLTFKVKHGFKVGIVGRTGAGKSTIANALFRMIELQSGDIVIDGESIGNVNIYQLRSKLSIIPQDPILFDGTLRQNVDPFGQFSDLEIVSSLNQSGLSEFSSEKNGGLDRKLEQGGLNVSVGERQLVCLARALLKRSKVILLDEVSANMDATTDLFVQDTIRTALQGVTCFIIAHKLSTVMNCDRILVLEDGKAVEFDAPSALLRLQPCQESNSVVAGVFERMVNSTGEEYAKYLRSIAR
jgi:ABC-type multidrug transport system fused ATPase/permease subunit